MSLCALCNRPETGSEPGSWCTCSYRQLDQALREAKGALSDAISAWIPVEERLPDDAQTVLGCWVGPSVVNEGMESLVYHAADAPDGPECWRDVFGEKRDPPTHWTLKELPK